MASIKEVKSELRKATRKALRALNAEERAASDKAIFEQVVNFSEYEKAGTVFLYVGIDWEINTMPLIEDALSKGKKVSLPLITGDGIMEGRYIESLDDLTAGAFDIPEPKAETKLTAMEEIDLALIPCVACDASCMRLGQGGGFYDRFMKSRSFKTAALCRGIALLDKIPVGRYDLPADYVITEDRIYCKA